VVNSLDRHHLSVNSLDGDHLIMEDGLIFENMKENYPLIQVRGGAGKEV